MALLNEIIQSERKSVSQVYEAFTTEMLYVDNTFQRRTVWIEKNKIRLIETILMGFPMPELYLWRQKSDPKTGKAKDSIVDGQQRVNAIVEFISDEWPLKKAVLDKNNQSAPFAAKKFSELQEK